MTNGKTSFRVGGETRIFAVWCKGAHNGFWFRWIGFDS